MAKRRSKEHWYVAIPLQLYLFYLLFRGIYKSFRWIYKTFFQLNPEEEDIEEDEEEDEEDDDEC